MLDRFPELFSGVLALGCEHKDYTEYARSSRIPSNYGKRSHFVCAPSEICFWLPSGFSMGIYLHAGLRPKYGRIFSTTSMHEELNS